MVKIVVFDLDGTLYDLHKHIDKDTVHKIIELEQKRYCSWDCDWKVL